jgi:hypothetical protein
MRENLCGVVMTSIIEQVKVSSKVFGFFLRQMHRLPHFNWYLHHKNLLKVTKIIVSKHYIHKIYFVEKKVQPFIFYVEPRNFFISNNRAHVKTN